MNYADLPLHTIFDVFVGWIAYMFILVVKQEAWGGKAYLYSVTYQHRCWRETVSLLNLLGHKKFQLSLLSKVGGEEDTLM
ncbi:MAG: hypothetical protein MI674_07200 [Cytophagales bacterium]|nr:hypothetical protein [Cytophagales bacterium]